MVIIIVSMFMIKKSIDAFLDNTFFNRSKEKVTYIQQFYFLVVFIFSMCIIGGYCHIYTLVQVQDQMIPYHKLKHIAGIRRSSVKFCRQMSEA